MAQREARHRYHPARMGSRGQPEESRAAILRAAAQEFAEHGIAGARTDAIARAARVNKALLYYYFKDKETLYGAVLDKVQKKLQEASSSMEEAQKQTSASGTSVPSRSANSRIAHDPSFRIFGCRCGVARGGIPLSMHRRQS